MAVESKTGFAECVVGGYTAAQSGACHECGTAIAAGRQQTNERLGSSEKVCVWGGDGVWLPYRTVCLDSARVGLGAPVTLERYGCATRSTASTRAAPGDGRDGLRPSARVARGLVQRRGLRGLGALAERVGDRLLRLRRRARLAATDPGPRTTRTRRSPAPPASRTSTGRSWPTAPPSTPSPSPTGRADPAALRTRTEPARSSPRTGLDGDLDDAWAYHTVVSREPETWGADDPTPADGDYATLAAAERRRGAPVTRAADFQAQRVLLLDS